MKNIISCFRPFIIAPFIIYIFDMMAIGLNVYIPINVVTILVVGLFDILGLLILIFINLYIF